VAGDAHPVDADRVDAVRHQAFAADDAEELAQLLTVLAEPLRTRILISLDTAGEVCVSDLALALEASEDAVSYALRLLRAAGLVRRRREGRMGYYRLREEVGAQLVGAIEQLRELAGMHPEASADADTDEP
jgi:ArsR family transcriptional regulator, lead/cadmium/zinc/bismuth-responsive transcriptional repressor